MAKVKNEVGKNCAAEGRNSKTTAASATIAGFMFSALVGIVSGAFALFILSSLLSKMKDPAGLFSIAAMAVAVVAGFVAGKTASLRLPGSTRLVRALGVWLILGIVTVVISLVIPVENKALTDVSGTAYTATLAVASMLAAAIIGSGSKKRKAKPGSNSRR